MKNVLESTEIYVLKHIAMFVRIFFQSYEDQWKIQYQTTILEQNCLTQKYL